MASASPVTGREDHTASPISTINMDELSHLKSITEDDVYQQLRRHFIRYGKGGPCDLPKVDGVTNGLLLKLYVIKEECNASFRELKDWLTKLVPNTESVSESRVYQRILQIIKVCVDGDSRPAPFLQESHCFHSLSDSLSAHGLKRCHISGAAPYTLPPSSDIINKVVVDLEKIRAQEREGQSFVHKWVKRLSSSCSGLTMIQVKRKVDKCFSDYKKLSKNKNKSDQCLKQLNDFLNLPFTDKLHVHVNATVPSPKPDNCKLCSNKDVVISELKDKQEVTSSETTMHLEIITSLNDEKMTLIEAEKNASHTIKQLKKQLEAEKLTNENYKEKLHAVEKSKLYTKNHAQKRKLEEITQENDALVLEKDENLTEIKALKANVSGLQAKLKTEQTLKSKYKLACTDQTKIISDLTDMLERENNIKMREEGSSHRYSNNIRQTYYALQGEGNVAASNCSSVVATVAKHMFNTNLNKEDLPCKTSALNFSNEASVIAHHQVVDEIKKCDHFMFASDATSRQKAHYLAQHIQLSNGKVLSLGFSEIASDDSDTLVERCSTMFTKLCHVYCKSSDDDLSSLFKEVIKKMKSLMSDRASVMKCFDKKLAAFKSELLGDEDCSTHFLFCNAHFLLALSSAAEEAVSLVEKTWTEDGEKLGRDANPVYKSFEKNTESAAVRTVRMSSEVLGPRGDEKSGARQEWLQYCDSFSKSSKFTSYRSNRFNNLFENSTALLHHKDDIKIFLTDYVSHSNLKLQSIIADLDDRRVVSNIAALAFFNFYFTKPYWLLMNSRKTYLDFADYVRTMANVLTLWSAENFDPTSAASVFCDFQANDEDLHFMKEFFKSDVYDREMFSTTLKVIIDGCTKALKRQLHDFLDGGVFGDELKDEVREVLKTCPLTNLTGERLFGDLDYDMNRRRNTSMRVRSTYCMWKHNGTAGWLQNKKTR